MKKLIFQNKKGFALAEAIISVFLCLLVFIFVISNLNTYTYLIYPNINITQNMINNNFYFKILERDFADATSVITTNRENQQNPWWFDEPVVIRLTQRINNYSDPNNWGYDYVDYKFYVNEIKRNEKTLFAVNNLKWYIINYEDKIIATNDPSYSQDLLDYKKIVVNDEEGEHVIAFLNIAPNTATRIFGYFIDEENNIPYFFTSTRIIRPEYRSRKSSDDYTPTFTMSGKKYTYYGINDDRIEVGISDISIDENNKLSFKIFNKSNNSPIPNIYGIVLSKENKNTYGFKTNDEGIANVSLQESDLSSSFYILFFGDENYEELEYYFAQ